jgi:hypothetical protein
MFVTERPGPVAAGPRANLATSHTESFTFIAPADQRELGSNSITFAAVRQVLS